MSRFWRVDKALDDSEGLRWIRERLRAYDWSKADWVSVRRGRSEKYAFRGVCKSPRNGGGYRINCNLSRHAAYPIYQYMRVSPLYRGPDGSWPEAPEGHLVGDRYVAARSNTGTASNGNGCTVPWSSGARTRSWCSWWPTRPSTTSARRGRWRGGTAR
jgi:hypothetical protein